MLDKNKVKKRKKEITKAELLIRIMQLDYSLSWRAEILEQRECTNVWLDLEAISILREALSYYAEAIEEK